MQPRTKLLSVQYLRAIAALLVAYFHLVIQVPQFSGYLSFDTIVSSAQLYSGVWIFFVISGFIMYVTARELSAKEFAWRRVARIVPLYWTITLALCAIALLSPELLRRTDVTAAVVLKSLLFVPYHNPTQGGALFPLVTPGWTLNFEMAFYALFCMALLLRSPYRMGVVVGVLCAAGLVGLIYSRALFGSIAGFYTGMPAFLFAVGVCLGALYTRIELPRWACAALVVVGFWAALSGGLKGDSAQWAQYLGPIAIVTGAVLWERQFGIPYWRWFLLLGDASYSIYLVHIFAFGITREIWERTGFGGPFAAAGFAAASLLAALALALATYRLVERPALRLLRFRKLRPAQALSAN